MVNRRAPLLFSSLALTTIRLAVMNYTEIEAKVCPSSPSPYAIATHNIIGAGGHE